MGLFSPKYPTSDTPADDRAARSREADYQRNVRKRDAEQARSDAEWSTEVHSRRAMCPDSQHRGCNGH